MKKINKKAIILIILIGAVLIGYGSILLPGFRQLVSWEKTKFTEYEDFREVLTEYNSSGRWYFMETLPGSAGEMKYYWYIRLADISAGYSVCLDENDYEKIVDERMIHYKETSRNRGSEKVIYVHQEESPYYIENSGLFKSKMTFLEEVLQNPEAERQYYFLIINQFGPYDVTCYNGVILNDVTHEVIEFSAQLMEEPKF
ncbi:MAG: hypothetical protein J6C84_05570 [Lachnospiraceae bacterium]|nr:hypothetical protein [Lachnospiraceae bacterium]